MNTSCYISKLRSILCALSVSLSESKVLVLNNLSMAVPGSLPKCPLGYADLKQCHTEAYNFLSKALQLDESGRGGCFNS